MRTSFGETNFNYGGGECYSPLFIASCQHISFSVNVSCCCGFPASEHVSLNNIWLAFFCPACPFASGANANRLALFHLDKDPDPFRFPHGCHPTHNLLDRGAVAVGVSALTHLLIDPRRFCSAGVAAACPALDRCYVIGYCRQHRSRFPVLTAFVYCCVAYASSHTLPQSSRLFRHRKVIFLIFFCLYANFYHKAL